MLSAVLMRGLMPLSVPTFWSTLQAPVPTYLQVRVMLSVSPHISALDKKTDIYSLEMFNFDSFSALLCWLLHMEIYQNNFRCYLLSENNSYTLLNLCEQKREDFPLNPIKWKTCWKPLDWILYSASTCWTRMHTGRKHCCCISAYFWIFIFFHKSMPMDTFYICLTVSDTYKFLTIEKRHHTNFD